MQHLILQRMKLLAWCPKLSIFGPLATNPLNLHALIPIQYIVDAYATLVYTQRMKLLAWFRKQSTWDTFATPYFTAYMKLFAWCPKQSTSVTTTSWQAGRASSIFTTCTRCLQIAQAEVYASNSHSRNTKFKAIVYSMNIFLICTISSQSAWKPYYWFSTILQCLYWLADCKMRQPKFMQAIVILNGDKNL